MAQAEQGSGLPVTLLGPLCPRISKPFREGKSGRAGIKLSRFKNDAVAHPWRSQVCRVCGGREREQTLRSLQRKAASHPTRRNTPAAGEQRRPPGPRPRGPSCPRVRVPALCGPRRLGACKAALWGVRSISQASKVPSGKACRSNFVTLQFQRICKSVCGSGPKELATGK